MARSFFYGVVAVFFFALLAFYWLIPQPVIVVKKSIMPSQPWTIPALPDNNLRLQAFENIIASLPADKKNKAHDPETVGSAWKIRGVVADGGIHYALVEKKGTVKRMVVGQEVVKGLALVGIDDDRVILSDGLVNFPVTFFVSDTFGEIPEK